LKDHVSGQTGCIYGKIHLYYLLFVVVPLATTEPG